MSVYDEIRAERERAHAKHRETSMEQQPVDALLRLAILTEEVGEVAREFNDARHRATQGRGPGLRLGHLRAELIQVAAMAAGWADACNPTDLAAWIAIHETHHVMWRAWDGDEWNEGTCHDCELTWRRELQAVTAR